MDFEGKHISSTAVGVEEAARRAMVAWLPAFLFLLLSWLWAPTICSVIGDWLAYLLIWRKQFASEPRKTGGLQVILCGFPRTGTWSLTEALQILGFRCLHARHLFRPTTAQRFLKAYKHDNPKDWEKLFEGFTAISDYMATCSYRQLARLYPNAKIILNIRDPNKWFDSISNTLLRMRHGEQHMVFKIVENCNGRCVEECLFKKFFDGKPENRETFVTAFLQHVQDVKKHVPTENLLIYDLEKHPGWPDLCEFLNVPVPGVSFPSRNDTSDYKAMMKRIGNVYTMVLAIYVAFVACGFLYII